MHLFRFRSIFTLIPAELHFNWNWKRSWDVCCSQFTMNVKLFAEIWWSLWLCVPVPMYIAMATVYISNGTTNHYHIQFEFAIAMLLDWIQYFIWIWIWLNGRIGKKSFMYLKFIWLASEHLLRCAHFNELSQINMLKIAKSVWSNTNWHRIPLTTFQSSSARLFLCKSVWILFFFFLSLAFCFMSRA